MSQDPNDLRTPARQVMIKDRVLVSDDSRMSGATMLGGLVAVMLIGGALLFAFSGDRDSTASVNAPASERSMPDSTTGQGGTSPSPSPASPAR